MESQEKKREREERSNIEKILMNKFIKLIEDNLEIQEDNLTLSRIQRKITYWHIIIKFLNTKYKERFLKTIIERDTLSSTGRKLFGRNYENQEILKYNSIFKVLKGGKKEKKLPRIPCLLLNTLQKWRWNINVYRQVSENVLPVGPQYKKY